MSSQPQQTESRQPKHQAIVEVTDDTGRVIGRESFESRGEAEQYAAGEEAKGQRAKVSSLDPKPKETI